MTARKDRKRARGADSANGGVANGGPSPENWPASKVELWDLDRIQPYERNPKVHPDSQIALIAASMLEDGVTAPILVDEAGVIIYGHGRRLAAIKNGFSRYPVVQAIGWPEDRKRAVRIKDNSYAALATWNAELIKIEITDLKMSGYNLPLLGFPESQLRAFGVSMGTDGGDPETAPEPSATPVSKRGDVWVLGKHRLVCGDSTNADDVRTSLNGATPHLMVTDPPYGVEYDPAWRADANKWKGSLVKIGGKAMGQVSNDHLANWTSAWDLFKGDVAYVWHGGLRSVEQAQSLESRDFVIRSQIIWNKGRLVISRGDYHWQHEACWYAVRKGKTGYWNSGRTETTVWDIPKPQASETGHGTQKPIECMRRPIENNSKAGDAVYEPFAGSFTTGIACEMTGRRCLAIELDPGYVDVGVLRWEQFSKREAILESTGKTFAETVRERKMPKRARARRGAPQDAARASGKISSIDHR